MTNQLLSEFKNKYEKTYFFYKRHILKIKIFINNIYKIYKRKTDKYIFIFLMKIEIYISYLMLYKILF